MFNNTNWEIYDERNLLNQMDYFVTIVLSVWNAREGKIVNDFDCESYPETN